MAFGDTQHAFGPEVYAKCPHSNLLTARERIARCFVNRGSRRISIDRGWTEALFYVHTKNLLLDAFYLQAVEFDGGFAAEHVDQHLELALGGIDLADGAVEAFERSVDDVHDLAQVKVDLVLRLL